MAIRFVLDENLRGPLWRAILRHNASGGLPIDATQVGVPPDLPLAIRDDALLQWCDQEGRILVSLDRETLPGHLNDRLASGGHSPGILLFRAGRSIPDVLEVLELISHAGHPSEFSDRVVFIP